MRKGGNKRERIKSREAHRNMEVLQKLGLNNIYYVVTMHYAVLLLLLNILNFYKAHNFSVIEG